MKVALVHDWLLTYRGGEQVLEALAELFPAAPIFTLFHEPGSMPPALEQRVIHTSPLNRVAALRRRHRQLLPLFPWAVAQLDLRGFDLVVSSSHCAAKAVRIPKGTRHLSYVHAPLRYMWDRFDDYFGAGRAGPLTRAGAHLVRPWLQAWDVASAGPIDRVVANSRHVANLIASRWGRTAEVVHPPVQLDRFLSEPLAPKGPAAPYVVFGAMAPYKRVDVALAAAAKAGFRLVVGGAGQEAARLSRALPPNVTWLGAVPDAQVPRLLSGARALIFPGEEDFGLVPLEAQACGVPVIALGRGGARETVTAATGLFYDEPTTASLIDAVTRFEAEEWRFDGAAIRTHAAHFSKERFLVEMQAQVDAVMAAA